MRAVFLPIVLALIFALIGFATARSKDTDVNDKVSGRVALKTHIGQILQKFVSGPRGEKLSDGVYSLQVNGPKAEKYTVIIDNGVRQVVEGEDQQKMNPDVTLTAESKDLKEIMSGSISPKQAYLSGTLKVEGKIDMLMGLEA